MSTGACYCKAHVTGSTCDVCENGYYALDDVDFETNGCTHECSCSDVGSRNLQCVQIGEYSCFPIFEYRYMYSNMHCDYAKERLCNNIYIYIIYIILLKYKLFCICL